MSMPSVGSEVQACTRKSRAFAATLWIKRVAAKLWLGIREWCGDSAYERYVQAQSTNPEKSSLLTPTEFYVERVNRRYSHPNRCC
jgi:uncharacterized short protein YbdD (DUF466 family)